MYKTFLLLSAMVCLIAGCNSDVNDAYAHERAFLKFPYANTIAPLYTALNSTGQWCSIELGASTFIFKSATGSTATYPYTAEIKSYGQPQCLVGFVVGKASQPDMNMQYPVMAYDLACPVCYAQSVITRKLTFSDGEHLYCSRCKHTFDLSNNGYSHDGTYLLRYRTVLYSSQGSGMFVVMN